MSANTLAEIRIMANEGFREHVYKDLTGHNTVGFGTNLDAGISRYAATGLLITQVKEISRQLNTYWWYPGLDDARCSVLIELVFWIGFAGLGHFPKMLTAIAAKDWQTAHDELVNSKLVRGYPRRGNALAAILLGG